MATTTLGLPAGISAVLFDLDGVLTRTTPAHKTAWAQTFEAFLRRWSERTDRSVEPYDAERDYATYVDGKRRADGVRDLLASRDIVLPEGSPDDPPDADTVYGVGNAKNELLLQRIARDGVEVYDGSRRYLEAVRAAGFPVAVVSSSANTAQVLSVTGLDRQVDVRVDGVLAAEKGLAGKPAPDTFVYAAERLRVPAQQGAVFEDALAGVRAGRAGGFGHVVGVDRLGQADALRDAGADVVVADLAELL